MQKLKLYFISIQLFEKHIRTNFRKRQKSGLKAETLIIKSDWTIKYLNMIFINLLLFDKDNKLYLEASNDENMNIFQLVKLNTMFSNQEINLLFIIFLFYVTQLT